MAAIWFNELSSIKRWSGRQAINRKKKNDENWDHIFMEIVYQLSRAFEWYLQGSMYLHEWGLKGG